MVHILLIALTMTASIFAVEKKHIVLTNPILKGVDGILITKRDIGNMEWLRREIHKVHMGTIKLNAQGLPDPLKTGIPQPILFRNQPHTFATLIELEEKSSTFTKQEKADFQALFQLVKDYAEKVNNVLLDDARGTFQFMMELIKEYCQKAELPDCELLKWKKDSEVDHYRKTVNSFKKLYVFSTDLMNFLGCLIDSCPIAKESYIQAIKAQRAQQKKS